MPAVPAAAARTRRAESLGLPDISGRGPLLAGLAIDSFGSGCAGPLLLLFFTRVAHIPVGRAGLIISAATVFSIVVPAIVAHLIDRVGPRNLVIGAQFGQCLAFSGLLGARSVPLLFCCTLIMTTGQRVFWSSIFSLLADVSHRRDRDRWFGLAGMMQAGGFGLGSLAAGVLLIFHGSAPYLIAMGLNAGSFLVAGWLLSRLHAPRHLTAAADPAVPAGIGRDLPYIGLIGLNTVLALCSMVFGAGLPIFVADALPAPAWIVGVLFALLSVILATGQTMVVRHSENRRRTRVLVLAALAWVLWGPVMAGLVHAPKVIVVPGLLAATLLFACGDLLHAATHNALAAAAAPERARGRYLSYWQYSFTIAGVIAPAFFAQLFAVRAELPWLALSVLAAATAAGIVLMEPVLRRRAVG